MATHSLSGMLKINFPGTDPKSIPTLSAESAGRLPPTVAGLFVKLGSTQDLGDLAILTIDDLKHRPTVLRTVQWLETGEYEPFDNRTMLQVHCDGDMSPTCYNEQVHQNNTAFRATAVTYAFFLEEIKLYAFSVLTDFTELQRHSGRKIMFHYPVYAAEITALLTSLDRNGIKNLAIVDPKLADFMGKRIACCRKDLLKDEALLPFLRNAVEPKNHFKVLLHQADQAAVDKAIAQLSNGIRAETELSTLLDAFVDTKVPESQKATEISNPSPQSTRERGGIVSESVSVFKVLAGHRLVVAGREGYGTLRVTRSGERLEAKRNTMFRFSKGELLLVVPHDKRTVNGPNDLVVCNQQGEIGEVFKALQFRAVQEFTNRHHNVEPTNTMRALPSPASIKSDDTAIKREHSIDDLFPNRTSRQRLN